MTDYKFLAARAARPRTWLQQRHLIAVLVGLAAAGTALGLIPDDAGATRLMTAPKQRIELSSAALVKIPLDIPPPAERTIAAGPFPASADNGLNEQWHSITIKQGDNLAMIFARLGLSAAQLHQVISSGSTTKTLAQLYPGQQIDIRLNNNKQLEELVYVINEANSLRVARQGDSFKPTLIQRDIEIRVTHARGAIDSSLFESGQNAGLSDKLIMELVGIFGWDIDFALDIREGDSFAVLYEEKYLDAEKVGEGSIVAAEFTSQGKTYRAVRYTDERGHTDYFAPTGHSMRKAFLRTPAAFSRISSRFGKRHHPVLNRMRVHRGVDYAAPRGTPVKAAGDGKIVFMGRKGGYGKTLVIRHGGKYSTLYAHLSGFKRRIRTGQHVRQGEVIGYVGSTGLATGPHLHYEFRVNGIHRNPLTVQLPSAKPISPSYRDNFVRQARALTTQLDLLQRTVVALNQ